MITAKLYSQDSDDDRDGARRSARRETALDGTVRDTRQRPLDVLIADLAEHGFRAQLPRRFAVGQIVRLGLSGIGAHDAEVVWRKGREHGCAFLTPLAPGAVERALVAETVVPFGGAIAARGPMIADKMLPGWARVALLIGMPALLWTGLGYLAMRLIG